LRGYTTLFESTTPKTAQPITKFSRVSRLYWAGRTGFPLSKRQMLQFRDNAAVVW